ncbi:MAG: hypothetical protein ABGX25_05405 [Nautiliaceae bacterium]
MLFLLIEFLMIVVTIYLCKKEPIKIPQIKYSHISLIIPFVIAVLFLLSFTNPLYFYINLGLIIFSIYYYIKKAENYLNAFYFKDPVKLLTLFIIINIFGGFLVNLTRFNQIQNQTLAIVAFILGVSLIAYARMGFVALSSVIAKYKNRSEYLGFLGILGVLGVLIVCILKPKK